MSANLRAAVASAQPPRQHSSCCRFAVKGMRTGGGRRQPEALDVLAEAAQEASVTAPQGMGPAATAAAFAAALGQYGALPGGLPMLGWASQVNTSLNIPVAHRCARC